MKRILLIAICLFAGYSLNAQDQDNSEIPYIEVTGSADIEIEPDEIRLTVVLGESKDKKGNKSLTMEEAEKILMDNLAQNRIGKDKVILKNAMTGGRWYYYKYYDEFDDNDMMLRKEYEIILADQSQLTNLLSALPGPKHGFVDVSIGELKNKKIAEYRKQTKIEAMKAARDKARYLLESVGASPGRLIQVIEINNEGGWYRPAMYSNALSQVSLNAGRSSAGDEDGGIKKIKLRYEMKVRFEIK